MKVPATGGKPPRQKEVVIVNAAPKKKKRKKTKTKTATRRRAKAGGARRKNPSRKVRRRRVKSYLRRKNPGVDVMGMIGAIAGGVAGEIVTTTAAHFVGKTVGGKTPEANPGTQAAAAATTSAVLGAGLGVAASLLGAPSVGKGMAAVGAAGAMRRGLQFFAIGATGPTFLAKAGFGQLELPDGSTVYKKDGVLYRKVDGQADATVLLGFAQPRAAELDFGDGREQVTLLGDMPGGVLYQDRRGQLQMLEGYSVREVSSLGDLVTVQEAQTTMGDLVVVRR
jgi:hypothetical protein